MNGKLLKEQEPFVLFASGYIKHQAQYLDSKMHSINVPNELKVIMVSNSLSSPYNTVSIHNRVKVCQLKVCPRSPRAGWWWMFSYLQLPNKEGNGNALMITMKI